MRIISHRLTVPSTLTVSAPSPATRCTYRPSRGVAWHRCHDPFRFLDTAPASGHLKYVLVIHAQHHSIPRSPCRFYPKALYVVRHGLVDILENAASPRVHANPPDHTVFRVAVFSPIADRQRAGAFLTRPQRRVMIG